MFTDLRRFRSRFFLFSLLVLGLLCSLAARRGEPSSVADTQATNHDKYICLDEIQPGAKGYCLTVLKGTEVEKLDLEVLSIMKNLMPGRDVILVRWTDEKFSHTGAIAGASGSPVYIDGRLAGALALSFRYSKDPIYGVTPISEMLEVGQSSYSEPRQVKSSFLFDLSGPLDLAEVDRQMMFAQNITGTSDEAAFAPLPLPLVASGLPASALAQLDSMVRPLGLMTVSGATGNTGDSEESQAALVPGGCLAVPLATGDIEIAAVGTVTDVDGQTVYGLGHALLGYGPVNLPMAAGEVHAIIPSIISSFKLASALDIVGTLTVDQATAVRGTIGPAPRMIPLAITVERYNDPQRRSFDCQIVDNQLLTPLVLRFALSGASLQQGNLPPEHTVHYKGRIDLENAEPITFENVSTDSQLNEPVIETVAPLALVMNNPYKEIRVSSVQVDISVLNYSVAAHLWSVDLSDSKVCAGDVVTVEVVVESVRADKKKYSLDLRIPPALRPGKYELIVTGGYGYSQFLRQAAPQRFSAENAQSLLEALNNILQIRRDRLYCVLVLPAGGIALEEAELPHLPLTKTLVLTDEKRVLQTQPYQHWTEQSLKTGTVIADSSKVYITVEEQP